jgi:hypothetical protein
MDNRDKSIVTQVAFKLAAEIVANDKDQSDDTAVSRIALMGDTLSDVMIDKITSLEVGQAFAGTVTQVAAQPIFNNQQAPAPQYAPQQAAPAPYQQPAPIPGTVDDGTAVAWLDVCQNPDGWWDNRINKKNPKGPDFSAKKHNTNFQQPNGFGVGLWVNDKSIPASVKTHLGIR